MAEVVGIRFKEVGKVYYFDPDGKTFEKGDRAIVETARGVECGEVTMGNSVVDDSEIVKPLKSVIRAATKADLERVRENAEKEKKAFSVCEEKILKHKLDMKLVNVEYTFDGGKILFYFTADGQNYHCDIGNLDPNASYRVTISYDSSRYYLYGLMKVEGIG